MNELISKSSWLLASVAALNWGAVEAFDTNLITDTLALDPSLAGILYIVIGLAGVVNLYDFVEDAL